VEMAQAHLAHRRALALVRAEQSLENP